MVHNCIKLECRGKLAVAAGETASTLSMISLSAPKAREHETRAAVDIVCVIDRSGSMRGQKLALVKEALGFVQRQMLSQDRFAIVSYATDVRTDLRLTAMDPKGRSQADEAVKCIQAGQQTNLSGGLLAGISALTDRAEAGRPASILLFTDGLANQGIRDTDGIVSAMNGAMAHSNALVPVYTFGFGADHSEDMLQAISSASTGIYYFVENAETIPDSFADCLGGLVSVAAQNVQLRVTAGDGSKISQVHTKSTIETIRKEEEIIINLGDLYCEESRDLIVSVEVPPGEADSMTTLLSVELMYFNVLDCSPETATSSLTVARPAVLSAEQETHRDEHLEEQISRVQVAEALLQANACGQRGDYQAARDLLADVSERLSHQTQSSLRDSLRDDLQQCRSGFSSGEEYASWGSKMVSNRAQGHYMQRSCSASMAYQTPSKRAMIDKCRTESLPECQQNPPSRVNSTSPTVAPQNTGQQNACACLPSPADDNSAISNGAPARSTGWLSSMSSSISWLGKMK